MSTSGKRRAASWEGRHGFRREMRRLGGGARWHRAGSGGAVFWLVPRTGWLAVWMVMVVSLVAGCRPDRSGRFQFIKSLRATERGNRCQVGTRHGHTRPALEQYGAGVQIALGPFDRSRETGFLKTGLLPSSVFGRRTFRFTPGRNRYQTTPLLRRVVTEKISEPDG